MENIISWNATNWITIMLMVTLGFLIVATATQAYKKYQGA